MAGGGSGVFGALGDKLSRPDFWSREARALAVNAQERRSQAPTRFIVIVCFTLCAIFVLKIRATSPALWAWVAAAAATQLFEISVLWRFRPDAPAPGWAATLVGLVATLMVSSGFASSSLALWRLPGLLGPAVAVLVLTGCLLNVMALSRGSGLALVAASAPHAAFLLLGPLTGPPKVAQDPLFIIVTLGGLLFLMGLAVAWRRDERLSAREAQARLAAEEATQAKTLYAAAVSHELRTPLTALLAAADALARRAGDPADAECARMIGDAGRGMRSLLDDLLDLAKMEAGRMGVDAVTFAPRALLEDVRRLWAAEMAGQALSFELAGADSLPTRASGDPGRLRQVVNNLVSNAVKFTPSGCIRIEVSTTQRTDGAFEVRIGVVDTGCGIEPERLQRLFSPFEQGSDSVARTHGGTGLGLAISRELARLMGGDLVAESGSAGSRFTLSVVLQAATGPVTADEAAAPVIAEPNLGTGSLLTDPSPRDEGAAPGRPRLLVVDDQPLVRRAVAILLEPVGLVAEYAHSGAEALERLAAEPFDLVLMDVHLADFDGREVVKRLRGATGPSQAVTVLAMTGAVHEGALATYVAAGMNGWVVKPLEAGAFYAAIDSALRPRHADDATQAA